MDGFCLSITLFPSSTRFLSSYLRSSGCRSSTSLSIHLLRRNEGTEGRRAEVSEWRTEEGKNGVRNGLSSPFSHVIPLASLRSCSVPFRSERGEGWKTEPSDENGKGTGMNETNGSAPSVLSLRLVTFPGCFHVLIIFTIYFQFFSHYQLIIYFLFIFLLFGVIVRLLAHFVHSLHHSLHSPSAGPRFAGETGRCAGRMVGVR